LTEPVRIKDLGRHEGQVVAVRGWVTHARSKGKIAFVVVRDGSGIVQTVASLQDVGEEALARMNAATQEASVVVSGTVRADKRAPGATSSR